MAAIEYPLPPRHLRQKAKTVWVSVLTSYAPDKFNAGDLMLFEVYCEAVQAAHDAAKGLKKDGPVTVSPGGKEMPSAAMRAFTQAANCASSLAGRLRISPVSRLQVTERAEQGRARCYQDIPESWAEEVEQ